MQLTVRRLTFRATMTRRTGPARRSAGSGGGGCGRQPTIAGVPDRVDFNFHVKPILSDRCFKCHGPDDRQRKASLRLDVKDVAFGELALGQPRHRPRQAGPRASWSAASPAPTRR